MLKKCLKYDFRSVFRLWWIMAVSMLGAAVVAGLGIRFFSQCAASPDVPEGLLVLSSFTMIGSMFCLMAMVMGMTVSFILVFWRMYTHFYTDEGYLTFTLPAKRSTLYLSKVLAGAILDVSTITVLLLNIALIVLIAVPTSDGSLLNPIAYEYLGQGIAWLWNVVGPWLILWVVLVIAFFVLLGLCASGLTYLCITIGAVVAKKHKLLAGIGIYYLVNSIVSLVGQILSMFLAAGVASAIVVGVSAGGATMVLTITITLLIAILVAACVAMLYHFMTMERLEKKLNLA